MFFYKLDLSHARKVFVVGDIHGMFTLLEDSLKALDFDKEQDHLLSVGDLVDRGPESHLAVEYAEKPWFHYVRGNHEDFLPEHLDGQGAHHVRNGGAWFTCLSNHEMKRHSQILNSAPVVMEVLVPNGEKIGIVHADFPSNDWSDVYDVPLANQPNWSRYCMWARNRIGNPPLEGIRNIDHVYFGHTVKENIFRVGNCSWIDTGAVYDGGKLTIVEIK